jgi:Mg-chelatase subunit ChlD
VLFLALIAGILTLIDAAPLRAQSQLTAPDNIKCEGYERDTVVVRWKDTTNNETEYRVERAVGDDSTDFTEVATLTPDMNGNYDAYRDTGIDVDQNYRYRVRAYNPGDSSFSPSPYSEICENRRIYETDDFRIFYGLENIDDCPKILWKGGLKDVCLVDDENSQGVNTYVARQEQALDGSVAALSRLGFARDAGAHNNLDRVPINVVWCDGGGCAGGGGIGLSPLLLEKPFDLSTRIGDPAAWVVALHEVFHLQQFKYWGLNDPHHTWVLEGQARSIQDKICIGGDTSDCEDFDDIDTGYAGYVPQVRHYLDTANRPINQASYSAALFWTYLTEKFGTDPPPSNSVERGMDLMVQFWENSANTPGRDGVAVLNETLSDLGHSEEFRGIWKDFAVANYAKDLNGPNVPNKYQYADMDEPGGNYGPVKLRLDTTLAMNEQLVDSDETVSAWGARYYEVRPESDVPIIDVQVTQDSTFQLYYTLLAIKDSDIVKEINREARDFSETLVNNDYDAVVLVVAGLEKQANYRYSFNGTEPTLNIVRPTTGTPALVGSALDPGKFQVQVEVLAGDGTPLEGIDPNNFSFVVGSNDVVTDSILTAASVQDQQWFVLRAPDQLSAGLYDLQVTYGETALSGTETDAVNYTSRDDADNMIILDHSGSMSNNSKIESAKDAAQLYVDSWRSGDMLGVVGFDTSASLDMQLQDWNDSATPDPPGNSREEAFNTIDGYTADNETAIGDALRDGWDELIADGDTSHNWTLVLLSDGLDNSGSESFDDLITALRETNDKQPQVHAIAIGPDADRLRMQRVANVTDGSYHAVALPAGNLQAQADADGTSLAVIDNLRLDMDYRYRVIATDAIGQQQFFNFVGPADDVSETATSEFITIPVEGSAGELVLSMSWEPTGLYPIDTITLTDPDGNTVEAFQTEFRHYVWRVPNPQQGDWTLSYDVIIPGLATEPDTALQQDRNIFLPDYLVHGALRSDVTMDTYLGAPEDERLPGVPMPIIASLTDTGPIVGATVTADIVLPNGSTSTITLYDDGAHDDGAADDGLYSGTFYQTGTPGSYNVTVNADGNSSLSGDFTRQQVLSFHIFSEGEEEATEESSEEGVPDIFNDRDNDGIPDEWEERNGTDPDSDDAADDPDNDGSSNTDEWKNGTDPFNSDTDQGGESDGSESSNGRDPRDPSDDVINPPWLLAYPRDGANYLWYTLESDYDTVAFYRSNNPDGPFSNIGQNNPGTGIYTDTNVANGTMYCYYAVALDNLGNLSGHRDPSCVTPKVDSVGPHGSIQINDGDQVTTSPSVTLNLAASDAIDPESEIPNNPIPRPADDSTSGVADMKIGNEGDLDDGVWEPFAPSKSWTLSQTNGLASVFVRYRDAAGNVSDIYPATIRVDPTAVTSIDSVQIDGPTTGVVGTDYDFTATVSPISVTMPLSYSWQIPEQAPVVHSNVSQITDTITATWSTPGSYTLMVTATNEAGSRVGTHTIDIDEAQIDMSITLEAAQSSIPADGSSTTTISATVRDSNDAPVANQAVSFETDLGSVNPASTTTDANGVATTTLQAGNSSGTAIVIARSNGTSRSINIQFGSRGTQNAVYIPLVIR